MPSNLLIISFLCRFKYNVNDIEMEIQFILFRVDFHGTYAEFSPISVIEFSGSLSEDGQTSGGHYTNDSIPPGSQWYHFDDNQSSTEISVQRVSSFPSMILFKKCKK